MVHDRSVPLLTCPASPHLSELPTVAMRPGVLCDDGLLRRTRPEPEPLRAAWAAGCPRARWGHGDGGGGGGFGGGALRGGPSSSGLGRASQSTSAVTVVSNAHTTTPPTKFSQSTSVISV